MKIPFVQAVQASIIESESIRKLDLLFTFGILIHINLDEI